MRIEELTIYRFDELSEEAQEKAINEWRINDEFFDGEEIVDTLRAFAKQFSVELNDWQLGEWNSYINYSVSVFSDNYFNGPDCIVCGLRLWKYLINNNFHLVANPHYDYQKKRDGKAPLYVDIRKTDCPLTGVCFDYDILAPILDFLKNPLSFDGNYYELIGDCLEALIGCYVTTLEDWYSEERIREDIENQECEFLANGERH